MAWSPPVTLTELMRLFNLSPQNVLAMGNVGYVKMRNTRFTIEASTQAEAQELLAAALAAQRLGHKPQTEDAFEVWKAVVVAL